MPHMPRVKSTTSTKPKATKPRRQIAVMSVRKALPVEGPTPDNHKGTTSFGDSSWAEDPWEGVDLIPTRPKRGPTIVDHCSKPGQFWPDGQEPPFKGQKVAKRIFVTQGKSQSRREITRNHEEIKRLKDDVRSLQLFQPRTGDIELYHDYSDYDGTDEEDLFEMDEDDLPSSATAAYVLPPVATVHVPVGKWVDRGDEPLDPQDLDLLLEITEVPQVVCAMLLPSSALPVGEILKFKLPDIEVGCLTDTGASCFDSARPIENLDLTRDIPPKPWVYSLREALGDAIRDGKRSIIHPRFKDEPLPLWMLTLWETLHTVREAKMAWADADSWLKGKVQQNKITTRFQPDLSFFRAHIKMYYLPYHKTIVGAASNGSRNTLQLARLLSDDAWLSETLVDMMIQSTVRRLVPAQSNLFIADTELADAIWQGKPNFDSLHHTLKRLERTLAKGKILLFPVCIPSMNHFVAFRIDFERKTLCYGDSLNLQSEIGRFITRLQQWLCARFDGPFEDQGNTLSHDVQKDSCSCAMFAINTIAHHAFGDPLGIPDPSSTRAKWFERLAHNETSVSASVSTSNAVAGPSLSSSPAALPFGQTVTEKQQTERRQLIEGYEDKAIQLAAGITQLKKEKELERQKERQQELEEDQQRAAWDSRMQDIAMEDGMDFDMEPGEVKPDSSVLVPTKGKGNAIDRKDPSPRYAHAASVLRVPRTNRSRYSVSPARQDSSYHPYHRPVSLRHRPSSYRDDSSYRSDRNISARRGRSRSPEHFTPRGRSPSPVGARHRQPIRYQSPIHRRSHRTPSPRRDLPTNRRPPESDHSSHPIRGSSMQVSPVLPSIPGTLSLPMGFLQFLPPATITTVAGSNKMGSRTAQNRTTRFILERTNCLRQYNDVNPLSRSLHSDSQNRLLHIACYPPYHLLHVVSRGRLVVSKRTEIRLRLWRAQYPDVPLWFFAIRCLSLGLDWRVFANPTHLAGPLNTISAPRPVYLDHKPLLLRRGEGAFEQYDNTVRVMLRLPFGRRFCCMGSLLWRLAMQFGPDNLFSAALSGPSTDAFMHSNVERIGTDVDDTVTDGHINILLGLTDDNYTLWPPTDLFEKYMEWEGEWTTGLEIWFTGQITAIRNRDSRAFATRSQWTSRLGQYTTTSSKAAVKVVTEAQAELLCYEIDQMDPRSFAALD